jgi:predicted amidophosphoribosyltransferase
MEKIMNLCVECGKEIPYGNCCKECDDLLSTAGPETMGQFGGTCADCGKKLPSVYGRTICKNCVEKSKAEAITFLGCSDWKKRRGS